MFRRCIVIVCLGLLAGLSGCSEADSIANSDLGTQGNGASDASTNNEGATTQDTVAAKDIEQVEDSSINGDVGKPEDATTSPDTPNDNDTTSPQDNGTVDDTTLDADSDTSVDSASTEDTPSASDTANSEDASSEQDTHSPEDASGLQDTAASDVGTSVEDIVVSDAADVSDHTEDAGTESEDTEASTDTSASTDSTNTSDVSVPSDVMTLGDSQPTADVIPPLSTMGCSDGTREGFLDLNSYTKIAACGGAWTVPGIHNTEPSCDRAAGNDGSNPMGTNCTVTDLCAEGWRVCYGKDDVLSRNESGCVGIMHGAQSPAFFLARTSSVGAFDCSPDSSSFGGPGTSNDLFGCGDLGCRTDQGLCANNLHCDPLQSCDGCPVGQSCEDNSTCTPQSCFPLTLGSHNLCKSLRLMPGCNCTWDDDGQDVSCQPPTGGCGWCRPLDYWATKLDTPFENAWECGTNSIQEANNVTKTDPYTQGGVLCCRVD